MTKASIDIIRQNFDTQVERFSNIETGQTTAIDSPLCMGLISKAAKLTNPNANHVMDLGCGGGNYAVKITSLSPGANCTLVDISSNMLQTAQKRVNDIVISETDEINDMMLSGWLSILKKQVSEKDVEMYMNRYETEDTPRTLNYQLELMKKIGFSKTILLHKHFNFAAFGGIK
jgi:tRNA (cmo5U34)-methyltransferase